MDTDLATAATHRALASPTRARLLDVLRGADEPLDVRALAAALDLHVSTVRSHLEVLEEAGLVVSRPEPRHRPGRPRRLYEAAPTDTVADGSGYRFLASALSSTLKEVSDDPVGAATAAGVAWGRYLVERPQPGRTLEVAEALDRVTAMLDRFGFGPELDEGGGRVLLHRCPFLEVAREHQDIVCSFHLGLLHGALDELGQPTDDARLVPFVAPSLCIAELGRTEA